MSCVGEEHNARSYTKSFTSSLFRYPTPSIKRGTLCSFIKLLAVLGKLICQTRSLILLTLVESAGGVCINLFCAFVLELFSPEAS